MILGAAVPLGQRSADNDGPNANFGGDLQRANMNALTEFESQ